MAEMTWELQYRCTHAWVRMVSACYNRRARLLLSRQNFPKRMYIFPIRSQDSVHSAIVSRVKTIYYFHPFRKRKISRNNTVTVYSGYWYKCDGEVLLWGIGAKQRRLLLIHTARIFDPSPPPPPSDPTSFRISFVVFIFFTTYYS